MVSVILGAKRLSHASTLRYDKVFPSINPFWFSQVKMDNLTIDFYLTVLVHHGMQEGVEVGYNPCLLYTSDAADE